MEYAISATWGILELVSFFYFSKIFLKQKQNATREKMALFCSCIVMAVLMNTSVEDLLRNILSILVLTALSYFLFSGVWYHHLMITCFYFAFASVMDAVAVYGASLFLHISLEDLVWRKLLYISIVTIGKLLELLLAWLVGLFHNHQGFQKVDTKRLVLAMLFPIISLWMLLLLFHNAREQTDLTMDVLLFSGMLAVANIAILYLISSMEQDARKKQEIAMLTQQMEIQTSSILALQNSHRIQREAAHEYAHQLQTIAGLLDGEKIEIARSYVHSLQKTQRVNTLAVHSRHPIIDAILNQKYQEAKNQDIDIQIKTNDLSQLSLPTEAIVVLLSNLLDNAIEACGKLPSKRTIHCSLYHEDNVFLSIRNTTLPVEISDGYIPTSKSSKTDHGFGLPSIYRVLAELKAEYTVDYKNGWFAFVAEIPNVAHT